MRYLLLVGLGVGLWIGIQWRRRWLQQEAEHIASLIVPPVARFTGHDDKLRMRTQQRRQDAASLHARAAKVESGAVEVSSVALRMVKR